MGRRKTVKRKATPKLEKRGNLFLKKKQQSKLLQC